MSRQNRKFIREWLAQLWDDIKASTDAGLLGFARFVGLLYGPIDHQLPIDKALRKSLSRRLPAHAGWRNALGGITYLLFIILIVTGVLLSFYYRPSAQEAYPSIQYIVTGVTLGWLIRDLHIWSANLIVVVALIHMARVFFDGAYKPPRETNWLIGVVLLFTILAFGATGYLLPWDQWAYWSVTSILNAYETVPLVRFGVEVLKGDVFVSGATLSRFFALHVIVLPWLALGLLIFHFMLVRRHGVAPREGESGNGEGVPFFPNHLLRSFIVAIVVVTMVMTLAILFPRPMSDPATPFQLPTDLVSTWIVVDVTLALTRYLGAWGLIGFTALGVALAAIPLFDRSPERRLRKRPVATLLGLLFFTSFAVFWILGRQMTSVPAEAALNPQLVEERAVPRQGEVEP